jgi:hypothetical protein
LPTRPVGPGHRHSRADRPHQGSRRLSGHGDHGPVTRPGQDRHLFASRNLGCARSYSWGSLDNRLEKGSPGSTGGRTRVRLGLWWHPESQPGVRALRWGRPIMCRPGPLHAGRDCAVRCPYPCAHPVIARTAPHNLRSW